MKHLTLAAHLNLEALKARYRQALDPVARSQWQILWLLAQGQSTAEVARHTGYTKMWIYQVVHRYNTQGPEGVRDRRHANRGGPPLLSQEQQMQLAVALEGSAPDGGLWTGPKVARWIAVQVGRPVHRARGWEWLQRLQYRAYVPRPRHTKADPEAQALFKKNLARRGPDGTNALSHRERGTVE